MYALASAGHRRSAGSVCVLCAALAACQGPGVGWAPALDVQISWQAQHCVNLHVQISWQAQYFVNLRVQISWQAQHFVSLHVHCVQRLLLAKGARCTPWRRLGTGA